MDFFTNFASSVFHFVGKACLTIIAASLVLGLYNYVVSLFTPPPPPRTTPSLVAHIKGAGAFSKLLADAPPNSLVVVDFFATWCGPCIHIAPFVEELADKNPDAKFAKVQEDESPDVLRAVGIRAFPTFRFYVAGRCVGELLGADRAALVEQVERLKAAAARGDQLAEAQPAAREGGGCTIA